MAAPKALLCINIINGAFPLQAGVRSAHGWADLLCALTAISRGHEDFGT